MKKLLFLLLLPFIFCAWSVENRVATISMVGDTFYDLRPKVISQWTFNDSDASKTYEDTNGIYQLTLTGSTTAGCSVPGKNGNAFYTVDAYWARSAELCSVLSESNNSNIAISFWAKFYDGATQQGLFQVGSFASSYGDRKSVV